MSEVPARPAQHAVLPRGHRIARRYIIDSVIGEGAQSVVYLAYAEPARPDAASPEAESIDQVPSQDRVALKVIHRHLTGDPQIAKRFEREARILTRLDGEHVVKILDFVEDDGLLAIALEAVDGVSLEARLLAEPPLTIDEALEIALQICAALGAAHAAGIVHRDLKPANVLIERRTSGRSPVSGMRVKVVDFGLARVIHGDKEGVTGLTEQGMIFGTPEYMAPEQARGDEVDQRSDLYAAGVILYEMVVGHVPFHGRTPIGAMTAHLTEAPPSPRAERPDAGISPALDAVILRALEKEPLARYRTARAFAEAIDAARNAPPAPATPASGDPDAIADTDLNLAPPTLATARTLPTHQLPPGRPEQLRTIDRASPSEAPRPPERARDRPDARAIHGGSSLGASSIGTTQRSAGAPAPSTGPSASISSMPPKPATLALDPARPSRWIWVAVALLAAAVGILLGAFAGAR